jgi:hypothetical protein
MQHPTMGPEQQPDPDLAPGGVAPEAPAAASLAAGGNDPADGDAAGREGPATAYRTRQARYAVLRDAANRARYRAANLCAVLLLAALVCLGVGIFGPRALLGAAAALGAAFVAAFAWQARLDERHRRYATLWSVQEEGLARLRRDWDHLPLRRPERGAPDHPYATDLDLLGRASLQHLLNTAATPAGQARLQEWLLAPAPAAVVRERQAAVAELARLVGFRDELELFGRLSGMLQREYEGFLAWAEQGPWLARRPALLWLSRALPALTLAAIAGQAAGLLHVALWIPLIVINLGVLQFAGKPVARRIGQVGERQGVFAPYGALFAAVAAQRFEAPLLRHLQARIAGDAPGTPGAPEEMRRLGRIMVWVDIRRWYLAVLIEATLLWDFHALWLLERWQARAGSRVRDWLEALSELEALAALGALAADHPDWAFPELAGPEAPEVVAGALGHPLLPPATCVRNDVRIGPPGTFLLVTGSNMSGKSTLLRAVGVNVALAQAGGPVCAAGLRLPPLALLTSMRVQDSLEQGVSYFLAELLKLKWVVDEARAVRAAGERVPCFLLDEILHGTNTAERQIAARRIIRGLLALGATGAVSTHDLTLADDPALREPARAVHFTERFTREAGAPSMTFDYRLRPGIATSTNALRLMEIVGLELDGAGD